MTNCPEMEKQGIVVEQSFGADHILLIQTLADNTIIRAPLNRNKGPCLGNRMLMDRKQKLDTFLLMVAFRLVKVSLAVITEATHGCC